MPCGTSAEASSGTINQRWHVFGYHKLRVCDDSAMPPNAGVNLSLTITALAEHTIAQLPTAKRVSRPPLRRCQHLITEETKDE